MKILHLAPISFISDKRGNHLKIGGLSNSVIKLACGQLSNDLAVGIVTTRESLRAVSEDIYWKSIASKSLLNLILKDPFINIIEDFGKPDVLHVHDIYEIKQLPFIYHAFRRNIKVYFSPRGNLSKVALTRNWFRKFLYINFLFKFFIKKIEAFVALNEGEKKAISVMYPNLKIIVISNGVEKKTEFIKENESIYKDKLKKRAIKIGFIGRFEVYIKGLDLFLESLVKFQDKNENNRIKVTLIGEHLKKKYHSYKYMSSIQARLKDPSRLLIKEPIFNEEKFKEMAKFDVFIHPSRTEGMPNAVLEAMSLGIPCMVSPETNMGEIIQSAECGWVIRNTEENIIQALEELETLSKKDLHRIGQNGVNYVETNLSWKEVAKAPYC